MRRASDRGFTLVEILVVLVIVGALATIVTLSVRGTTNQTETNACAAEQRAVATAIDVYESQNGRTPPDLAALVPDFLTRMPDATTATGGGTYDPTTGAFDAARC